MLQPQQSYKPKQRKRRQCGTIRQVPKPQSFLMQNLSINNINLFKQMHCISQLRSQAFYYYEKVIADLQTLVKKIQEQRFCLLDKNNWLKKNNEQLREQLKNIKQNGVMGTGVNLYGNFLLKKNQNKEGFTCIDRAKIPILFQVVEDQQEEEMISGSQGSSIKWKNQQKIVIQQSHPHHLSMDKQPSILSKQSRSISGSGVQMHRNNNEQNQSGFSQQGSMKSNKFRNNSYDNRNLLSRIRNANKSNISNSKNILRKQQSLIQIPTNQKSPNIFRTFYLCMLQSPILIKPLLKHLQFLITTHSDNYIMQDNLGQNSLWIQILRLFLTMVREGQFMNEIDMIEYIDKNRVIDVILVRVLSTMIPDLQDEDASYPTQDKIDSMIKWDMKILYGLCNNFDLHLQIDRTQRVFKIYQQNINQQSYYDNPPPIIPQQFNNLDIFINNNQSNNHLTSQRSQQSNLLSNNSGDNNNSININRQINMKKNKNINQQQIPVDISLRGPNNIANSNIYNNMSCNNNTLVNNNNYGAMNSLSNINVNNSYNNNNNNVCHGQPIINIYYDLQYKYYRTYITIRPFNCNNSYEQDEEQDQLSANFARTQEQSQQQYRQRRYGEDSNRYSNNYLERQSGVDEDGPSRFQSQQSPFLRGRQCDRRNNDGKQRLSYGNNQIITHREQSSAKIYQDYHMKKGKSCRNSISKKNNDWNNNPFINCQISKRNILGQRHMNSIQKMQQQIQIKNTHKQSLNSNMNNKEEDNKNVNNKKQKRRNRYSFNPDQQYLISQPDQQQDELNQNLQPQIIINAEQTNNNPQIQQILYNTQTLQSEFKDQEDLENQVDMVSSFSGQSSQQIMDIVNNS